MEGDLLVEGQGRDLGHLSARWAPWVITRSYSRQMSDDESFSITPFLWSVDTPGDNELARRKWQWRQVAGGQRVYRQRENSPFRTLICTDEYPLVTFLTLRTTFDMIASV